MAFAKTGQASSCSAERSESAWRWRRASRTRLLGRDRAPCRGGAGRAGSRNPLRIRVGGEELGLLLVGAKAADDDEVHAVRGGRGFHPIERERNVRTHRL